MTIKKENPIVHCKINHRCTHMAFVEGYDWSEGVWGLAKPRSNKLYVYKLSPDEVKRKNTSNYL